MENENEEPPPKKKKARTKQLAEQLEEETRFLEAAQQKKKPEEKTRKKTRIKQLPDPWLEDSEILEEERPKKVDIIKLLGKSITGKLKTKKKTKTEFNTEYDLDEFSDFAEVQELKDDYQPVLKEIITWTHDDNYIKEERDVVKDDTFNSNIKKMADATFWFSNTRHRFFDKRFKPYGD